MINYLRESFRRKIARRYTREYGFVIKQFTLENDGIIEFAHWSNPLVHDVIIKQTTVDFFRQFISEGDMVIDIGANTGDTTVPMSIAAGIRGLTLGFDPNPIVFKILEINSSLNKDKTNISPYCHAVSVEDDEFYFISSEASFSNGGISKTTVSKHGRFVYPEKVRGINLLNFLNINYQSWLPKLSFIKVDAEGYDKEIIKSLSSIIDKYKPVIVTESFGGNSDKEKYELFDVIKKHGYRIYYFSDFCVNAETKELSNRDDIIKWKETVNLYSVSL